MVCFFGKQDTLWSILMIFRVGDMIEKLVKPVRIQLFKMNWPCDNQMISWIDKISIWFLFMNNHANLLKVTENHENHVNSRRDLKLGRSRTVKIKQSRCQTFIFRGKWFFNSKESEMFQLDCTSSTRSYILATRIVWGKQDYA